MGRPRCLERGGWHVRAQRARPPAAGERRSIASGSGRDVRSPVSPAARSPHRARCGPARTPRARGRRHRSQGPTHRPRGIARGASAALDEQVRGRAVRVRVSVSPAAPAPVRQVDGMGEDGARPQAPPPSYTSKVSRGRPGTTLDGGLPRRPRTVGLLVLHRNALRRGRSRNSGRCGDIEAGRERIPWRPFAPIPRSASSALPDVDRGAADTRVSSA